MVTKSGVARTPEQLNRIVARRSNISKISRIAVDLNAIDSVCHPLRDARPDALIHLAWYANPSDYLTSHRNLACIGTTTALMEAALAAGCRKLILIGSCAEYAPQDRPVIESDPVDPRTLYAACKHSAWSVARVMAAQTDAELAWARIFHVHGPGEHERRLIPWVAGQIGAGIPVSLTDGSQMRDHLHVSDVAAGLVAMLRPGAAGIYNVCSGQPVQLRSVLETVGILWGGEICSSSVFCPIGPMRLCTWQVIPGGSAPSVGRRISISAPASSMHSEEVIRHTRSCKVLDSTWDESLPALCRRRQPLDASVDSGG